MLKILSATAFALLLQGKGQAQRPDSLSPHYKVFQQAFKAGDASLAAIALNYLVAENPATVYRDSLAMVYMGMGQHATALYWINQRLQEKSANELLLKEMQAQCLSATGNIPSAITVWEELVLTAPANKVYLWQLANAQYSIRRQAEALVTLQKIEALPIDSVKRVSYTSNAGTNELQYTTITAAAANLKGLILYEMKKSAEAKTAFTKASLLDEAYTQPGLNLAAMQAEEQEKNKPAPVQKAKPKPGS